MSRDCRCDRCVEACRRRPGWFAPGEAEKVAEFLGMTLEELFTSRLSVDYWTRDEGDTDVISPRAEHVPAGTRWNWEAAFTRSRCTFLTAEGLCEIHPVKPKECREAMPCQSGREEEDSHPYWKEWDRPEHQEQCEKLLGIMRGRART